MGELIPRAPRGQLASPVDLTLHDREDPFRGTSVNMSTTGMLVRLDEPIPSGTTVRFGVALYEGIGEVVRSTEVDEGGAFLGIKFNSITRSAQTPGPDRNAAAAAGLQFGDVTRQLLSSGIAFADLAHALGESPSRVRRFLLEPSNPRYVEPPKDWRSSLAPLARERGGKLDRVARQLEQAAPELH